MLGVLIDHIFIREAFLCKSNCTSYTPSIKNLIEIPFQVSSNIQIINLNQPINADFKCINTKKLLDFINTTICLHETKNEIYVSNSFQNTTSIWEEEGVIRILQLLIRHPHFDFIDIGANIGTYTMYAAALGRFVLAIDLSKKVLTNQNIIKDPYIVKTITFDELLPILVARGVRGAIIKIDIESSESFVVESGSRVFDALEIPFVQMEWIHVRSYFDRAKVIIDFFVKRNYDPKSYSCQLLNTTQYATWPSDVCWIKRNVSNFC
ncbi:unnamed protein product [Rotaria sordida]|uniref:Methyltransferase FkbM domain-containing protein n=1 Tax=Rotaria sordida TaxID=392033 RepID=A0A815MST7_9BILA|nr:unnamed protein product [Rotaria sordida]CAF1631570.1 unnamed protein product [Rotaria sordida]